MLVVGILIGVGISGRGNVDDAERNNFGRKIAGLEEEVQAANESADDFERRQEAAEDFVESAYPALAARRLEGKRIAILVLGAVDPSVSAIERAVEDDGDGRVGRMRALVLPLRLGAVESAIVEVREGGLAEPVDGVIVLRTGDPQVGETSRFLAGIYQGLGSAGIPVVGVEPTRVEQSAIPVFQRYRLSTVDGVDTPVVALAMLLVLADLDAAGDYGVRDTADRILPPIEPVPASSG